MGGQDYKSQQPRMRTMANERTHLPRRQTMVITQYPLGCDCEIWVDPMLSERQNSIF